MGAVETLPFPEGLDALGFLDNLPFASPELPEASSPKLEFDFSPLLHSHSASKISKLHKQYDLLSLTGC